MPMLRYRTPWKGRDSHLGRWYKYLMPGAADQPRDDHGRFSSTGGSGLGAFADKHGKGDAPGKVIGEAKAAGGGRQWTDRLPEGMKAQSWQAHYDKHPDEGGKASADRVKSVHEPIMREALDVPPAAKGEKKIAIMTMGAPASGKSSMLKGIDSSKFVKVDPDEIKGKLPEYQKAIDPANTYRGAAAMVHEESSHVAKQIMNKAIANGNHVIVDGTGANAKSMVDKMNKLKAAGYHVHVAFAHLDETEGIKRLLSRAEHSGRYVPEKFARTAYKTIPRNFERIARAADSFAAHDTSKDGAPVAWEKKANGEEIHHDKEFVTNFRTKHGKTGFYGVVSGAGARKG